jgi:hypothetical protein
MKREVLFVLIIAIVGMLFLSVSCATNTTAEPIGQVQPETVPESTTSTSSKPEVPTATPEPVESTPVELDAQQSSIAQLVKPKRVLRFGNVPAFGDYIVVTNETGYSLVQLDIFSESMYQNSEELSNILDSAELVHHGQKRIKLTDLPLLREALTHNGAESFTVNAFDTDGDRYTLAWQPETDSWNIILSPDELDFSVQSMMIPPPQGDYFLVTNNAGYPLNTLYVINPSTQEEPENIEDIVSTNLLSGFTLRSGSVVKIATEDVPWIADQLPFDVYGRVIVLAQDIDGDYYQKVWYPTSDTWNIELTIADLLYEDPYPSSENSGLYIENNTGFEIWYLYLTNSKFFAEHSYGEDLLVDSTLDVGQSMHLDLSQFPNLTEILASASDEPLHLVGLDINDIEYQLLWSPMEDGWQIELTDENFLPVPLPDSVYDYTTLLVENRCGEDIWYLYLVTEAMAEVYDNGNDVLGNDIWVADETQALVPELFPWIASWLREYPNIPITLVAETFDGTIYTREWSPDIHGWLINLSEEDRQE